MPQDRDPHYHTESSGAKNEGWHASLADGLATAEREQKPVLVDLWATWCKNCLTMDRTTLADPAVTAALANYVKIKLQPGDPGDATINARLSVRSPDDRDEPRRPTRAG
jgi:thiol:disulfide interchange protein